MELALRILSKTSVWFRGSNACAVQYGCIRRSVRFLLPVSKTCRSFCWSICRVDRVLFQRNPDRRFVPASITKVMTAYQAFELLEAHEIQPNQTFPFSRVSFAQWGGEGSTMFINAGDNTRVSDLLLGITTVSANDASIVLAEGAGGSYSRLARSNERDCARRLGMNNSRFGTPNGWPDEGRTFTTARDLVAILGTALVTDHPDQYRRFFGHVASLTYRRHHSAQSRAV